MPAYLLPAAAALFVVVASGVVRRRLPPVAGVWVAVGLSLLSVSAVVAALAMPSLAWLAHVEWIAAGIGWCRTFAATHAAPPVWLGASATAALGALVMATWRTWRRDRREVPFAPSFTVVGDERPLAYATDSGEIVVSAAMLRSLDAGERRALLAHERSHVRHRHHRYLRVVNAATWLPVLRGLRRQARFATERWADEDAAREIGDRRVVARAIARAALAEPAPVPGLALAGYGVKARVDALLDGGSTAAGSRETVAVATGSVVLGAAVATSTQFHHLAAFVTHVCGL